MIDVRYRQKFLISVHFLADILVPDMFLQPVLIAENDVTANKRSADDDIDFDLGIVIPPEFQSTGATNVMESLFQAAGGGGEGAKVVGIRNIYNV